MEWSVDGVLSFVEALNSLSPLAVIGLLGLVLWQMAKNQKVVTDNHLHGLPTMEHTLNEILETLQRLEVHLGVEFSYIRARLENKK